MEFYLAMIEEERKVIKAIYYISSLFYFSFLHKIGWILFTLLGEGHGYLLSQER